MRQTHSASGALSAAIMVVVAPVLLDKQAPVPARPSISYPVYSSTGADTAAAAAAAAGAAAERHLFANKSTAVHQIKNIPSGSNRPTQ